LGLLQLLLLPIALTAAAAPHLHLLQLLLPDCIHFVITYAHYKV